ncbi:hypothetical protein MKW92_006015 [Papaver armeniacum]|nr:hypothetical protein MKW92_006015 [Papaver armeniacum]
MNDCGLWKLSYTVIQLFIEIIVYIRLLFRLMNYRFINSFSHNLSFYLDFVEITTLSWKHKKIAAQLTIYRCGPSSKFGKSLHNLTMANCKSRYHTEKKKAYKKQLKKIKKERFRLEKHQIQDKEVLNHQNNRLGLGGIVQVKEVGEPQQFQAVMFEQMEEHPESNELGLGGIVQEGVGDQPQQFQMVMFEQVEEPNEIGLNAIVVWRGQVEEEAKFEVAEPLRIQQPQFNNGKRRSSKHHGDDDEEEGGAGKNLPIEWSPEEVSMLKQLYYRFVKEGKSNSWKNIREHGYAVFDLAVPLTT